MSSVSQITKAAYNKFDYDESVDTVVTSFTEPEVFIYSKPDYHSNIMDGRFVQGGSSFKKHFTLPFDQEARANGLAKHWGITGADILRLWKAKGKSTTGFGSGFHKILELDLLGEKWGVDLIEEPIKLTRRMYMANLELGEQVFQASKSASENYAKPTHLDIRALMKSETHEILEYAKGVVKEFHELEKSIGRTRDEVLAEVYVTCAKYHMGGEVDRLLVVDKENKICRVQDYKFKDKDLDKLSSNNKMINEMEKKKASENDIIRLQLSFYAFCLEEAGWTVQGGDVFGRNGEWNHYSIDLIPHEEMEALLVKYLK